MSKPYSAMILLAPALLCITAIVQRVQVETHDLNPWKGGGFGMFADIQKTANRFVVVTVVDPGNVGHWTTSPESYRRQDRSVRTYPTQKNIDQLAASLASEEWFLITTAPGQTRPVLESESWKYPQARPLEFKGVTVELFEYSFDRKSARMSSQSIAKGKSARQ